MGMRTVITGASGALGEAVVAAFHARGDWIVALDCVRSDRLPAGVAQIACKDLADERKASAAMVQAAERMGGIDNLVNLAGAFDWVPFVEAENDTFARLYRANILTAASTIRGGLAVMGKGGIIVCIGAASAQPAGEGMAAYAAAKSGVARLVEALSQELRERSIRINALLPSIIDTPRNRADMPDADPAEWTSPAAIADVIAFLCSPQSRAINGASLHVTNGVQ